MTCEITLSRPRPPGRRHPRKGARRTEAGHPHLRAARAERGRPVRAAGGSCGKDMTFVPVTAWRTCCGWRCRTRPGPAPSRDRPVAAEATPRTRSRRRLPGDPPRLLRHGTASARLARDRGHQRALRPRARSRDPRPDHDGPLAVRSHDGAAVVYHHVECDTAWCRSTACTRTSPPPSSGPRGSTRPSPAAGPGGGLAGAGAPSLVVADIPPLAFAPPTRRRPGCRLSTSPGIGIYEGYRDALARPAGSRAAGRPAGHRPRGLAPAMHGGFASYRFRLRPPARRAPRAAPRAEVARRAGGPADRPIVLVSFGGFGQEGLPSTPWP